jgi:DNA-binding GntR family transcriptional regulator
MVELTERFEVSQSVVREALTRLTEQGLLVATPQRGFRVRDLSVEDIAELTETRVQVESLALRLAVERGDLQRETGILAAHYRLERTPVTRDDGTARKWGCRSSRHELAILHSGGHFALFEHTAAGGEILAAFLRIRLSSSSADSRRQRE